MTDGFCYRDPKVHVTWARFEVADLNDLKLLPGRKEDLNGKKNLS